MTPIKQKPGSRGGAAGPLECQFLAGVDVQTNSLPIQVTTQDNFLRNPADARRVRLQYLARRLHGLGERPLFHFLDEVERGGPLRLHLERYAVLPADFIRVYGGYRFAPSLHVIHGGSR